jgi:alpha-beta hydrolase superfamily lysophospholipase
MVAEGALKALEKRKATFVSVPSWMQFKKMQAEATDGVLHVERAWIPCPGTPWGHDLHVTVFAPLDLGQIRGTAVLFHGLGNFGEREMYYLAPWLACCGYASIVPDLPYFGHNVIHKGAHGRIGKWDWQLDAMTECILWGHAWTASATAVPGLPWFLLGISMSGLGVLDYGLNRFDESHLGKEAVDSCACIVALVPAVAFRLQVSPVKKLLAFIAAKIAPDFVFDQQTGPDPSTGLSPVSHDRSSVQWCVPCIEPASSFNLSRLLPEDRDFEIDCFPGSPLSTVVKIYSAASRVAKSAAKWPRVPLFATGSGLDDLIDPIGIEKFVNGINPSIPRQFKLYPDMYHPQLGEQGREQVFEDILAFVTHYIPDGSYGEK